MQEFLRPVVKSIQRVKKCHNVSANINFGCDKDPLIELSEKRKPIALLFMYVKYEAGAQS